jgi:small subunit ribosomal protein S3
MGANAKGVEIMLSGKIVGKGGRARSEKYSQGYMKKSGNSVKLVRIGSTQASLKAGVIGVTVKIVPPDAVFPDQISLKSELPEKPAEKPVESKPAGESKSEDKPPKKRTPRKKAVKKEELPPAKILELPPASEKLIPEKSEAKSGGEEVLV